MTGCQENIDGYCHDKRNFFIARSNSPRMNEERPKKKASECNNSNHARAPGLFQTMRDRMRLAHMSMFTERSYVSWARRFVAFHKGRHPRGMGAAEITEFLTYLAATLNVSASTQNQALNALVYLYKEVLEKDPGLFEGIVWAKRPRHIPVVMTVAEVTAVLSYLSGTQKLIACLLYGTGMRLTEALKLRVKDVDFARMQIAVRDAKGEKD